MCKTEVRAVGFAGFSPEAVVLIANHSCDHLHFYPSKLSPSDELSLGPEDDRRHVVLLRTPEKLSSVAKVADRVSLLILFANVQELQALGVPVMDMEPGEDGKMVASPRQSVDKLLQRMEDEAVLIPIAPAVTARKEKKQVALHDGPTLRELLRNIRGKLKPVNKDFTFVDDVGVPAILRLMNDLSKDEFKQSCQNMIDTGGLDINSAKVLFRWVEGIEGAGPALGRAVDDFLFNDDENDLTKDAIAEKYGVDVTDLEFVSNTYRQLMDQK